MLKENIQSVNSEYDINISTVSVNKSKLKSILTVSACISTSSILLFSQPGFNIPNVGNTIDISIPGVLTGTQNNYFSIYNNNNTIMEVVDLRKMENLNKINYMRDFEYNWNGNGGLPFSEEAISHFERVITYIKKQPDIAPTGRESLLMQYELDDRSYLGFEVFKDKVAKVYIPQRDYSQAVEEIVTTNLLDYINDCVEIFYA